MVFRLLYFVTGVVTAIPVIRALGWAVWGAPVSSLEYLALLGSLILVISALIPSVKPRLAARIGFVGALAVWSCYLPAMVGMGKVRVTDQELSVSVFRWTPSSSALVIGDQRPMPGFPDMRLSAIELQQIKDTGINGLVSFVVSSVHGSGKKSHATLIMQRPVAAPIALKEPDGTSVVYVQEDSDWKMFPPDAPTLQRTIRIEPMQTDPNQDLMMVELATGALQGSGISWPTARVENPGK